MSRLAPFARALESFDPFPEDHCDARARWNPTQSELDLIHAAESARDHAQAVHRFHHLTRHRGTYRPASA